MLRELNLSYLYRYARSVNMAEGNADACRVGIAVVEDEKELVKLYKKVFDKKGIQICFVAFDGLEAVKKYVESHPKPHVVLMDYRLPIMDGVEATKEILEIDHEAKIIFLSADIHVKEEALQAGAFMFLKKPVSINDITNAINAAFGEKPLPLY
jgi:two-component system chemotaxis response regulator CheY